MTTTITDGRIAVRYCPTSALTLDPKNPRRHDRRQVRQIARSIEAFGFNVPILVDAGGRVIAGHGRLLAARDLGLADVPIIELEHLSEPQACAFMIADNRLTETSSWDERLLAEQLRDLAEIKLEFSLEATGFTMGEIDLRIEGLADPAQEDPADTIPTGEGPGVTKPGDLWILGRHRVLCADALDAASYATLMVGDQAAMVFTDPPYNVPIDGHATGNGATRHREFPMASGEMDEAEFTSFLHQAFTLLTRHTVNGSLHFICMDWRHLEELLKAGRVYSELKNLCIWAKSNAGMGSLYRSQHELIRSAGDDHETGN